MTMPNLNIDHNTKTLLKKIKISDDANALIEHIIANSKVRNFMTTVGFMNQHGFNLIAKNKALLRPFDDLDYILRDGIGMKLAFKFFNMPAGANLNGTDFIPQLIKVVVNSNRNQNTAFFVLGTQSPWLEEGAAQLLKAQVFQTMDGFRELPEYIHFLNQNMKPEAFNVIVLAMGMPKQEELAALIKHNIKQPGLVVCGGAIIDFEAGRFSRAPPLFRTLSIEWLYRLLKEPRRLFKRYVIGIPIFFINLIQYR